VITHPSPSSTADREIVLTRVFDAPRDVVFRAFTDPNELDAWWGPNGFVTQTSSMDLRVGGQWIYTMTHAQYGQFANRNVYKTVVTNERLEFRHDTGKDDDPEAFETTITFEDDAPGKTKVTMKSVLSSVAELERVKKFGAVEGGKQTLEKCAQHLERRS
jgi:uncharacterized protein YndB with AHSA1/START domain